MTIEKRTKIDQWSVSFNRMLDLTEKYQKDTRYFHSAKWANLFFVFFHQIKIH